MKYIIYLLSCIFSSYLSANSLKISGDVAVETYHYRYLEKEDGQLLMQQQGPFSGLTIGLNFQNKPLDKLFRLEGSYARGLKVDYKSPSGGTLKNTHHQLMELRLLSPFRTPLNDIKIELCLGMGYRNLLNDTTGKMTDTGLYGYRRNSHYWYLPIAIIWKSFTHSDYPLTSYLEYDFLIKGLQSTTLDQQFSLKNKQKHGYGLRAGIDFLIPHNDFDWFAGIFLRYWKVNISNEEERVMEGRPIFFWEPANSTREIGLKIGTYF